MLLMLTMDKIEIEQSTEIECGDDAVESSSERATVTEEADGEAVAEEASPAAARVARTRLPMSRVKNIMKLDPGVSLASADAVFLVTKATELFLETIAKEAYSYTAKSKKRTVTKKDLDTVIDTVDALCFLDGAMDF